MPNTSLTAARTLGRMSVFVQSIPPLLGCIAAAALRISLDDNSKGKSETS